MPGRREALEAMLQDLGVSYEMEPFAFNQTEGVNFVVTLGSGAADIVIGGHYDAVSLRGGALSRGAVDNAASVVILAHLAARLGDQNLRHRLRIVFFDMEEVGLAGSRRYIESHRGDTIRAAVNLDVNAYGDTVFYGPSAAPGNALLYDVMREHCAEARIPCLEFPAYPASDYLSFQAAGIPNISFSVLPATEAQELSLYLSGGRGAFPAGFVPRVLDVIHSPADSSDRVEAAAMDLALRSLEGFLRRLDAALDQQASESP